MTEEEEIATMILLTGEETKAESSLIVMHVFASIFSLVTTVAVACTLSIVSR